MIAHLRWADGEALATLRAAVPPPERALALYAHVVGAEHTWLARLEGRTSPVAIWPTLSLDEAASLATEAHRALERVLRERGGALDEEIAYTNSAGRPFRSRVGDVLLQVVTHGVYHRGQIAVLLRAGGAEPRATDYIVWARDVAAPPPAELAGD